MKKQNLTTSQERKMKFAEAGILITLVLALSIFVGTRLISSNSDEDLAVDTQQTEIASEDPVDNDTVSQEVPAVATDSESEIAVQDAISEEEIAKDASVQDDLSSLEVEPVSYAASEKTFFAGNFEEAAAMFSRYTDDHGSNAWGFYMLGLSEWKAGDPEAAEDAFLHALELKPEHLKSRVNYARALIQMERFEEAQAQIEMALAVNPVSVDATRVLGRVQHNLGLLDEAADSYRSVLSHNNEDAWALNNLGLVLIEQEDFTGAVSPLAKASLIRGEVACFQNNLGIALERTGYFTAAGDAYTSALASDASYTKAADNLARVENLTQDQDLLPIDLAALAAGFMAEPVVENPEIAENIEMVVDIEVASAEQSSAPEIDEPENDGSRNR